MVDLALVSLEPRVKVLSVKEDGPLLAGEDKVEMYTKTDP